MSENPYFSGRRLWNSNDDFKSFVIKTLLCLVLILSLLGLGAVSWVMKVSSECKYVPYVVEVDKLGRVQAVGDAAQETKIDERIVRQYCNQFIEDTRSLTSFWPDEEKRIFRAYALVRQGTAANEKLNEFFNGTPERNPQARISKETVEVQIIDTIPQSERTWQVEWDEIHRDLAGVVIEQTRRKALLIVDLFPPSSKTKEDSFLKNPFGIYIKDFSWNKEAEH